MNEPSIYQPFAFLSTGWRHRALIARLASRQIQARQRGSVLGMAWTVLHPLLMLAIYTFVFSVVFQSRWEVQDGGRAQFALFLFTGMTIYSIFSQCVNEAPSLMTGNITYIKQMRFPIEIFSWVSLAVALFDFCVSGLVLVAFLFAIEGVPPVQALYVPLVLVPVLLLALSASWFVASIGVFFRDIAQLTGLFTTALLFLSPIFYPASRIPESLHRLYFANPFASILEMAKGSLFAGATPDWRVFALLMVGSWACAWSGYVWFMRTKRGFADVL